MPTPSQKKQKKKEKKKVKKALKKAVKIAAVEKAADTTINKIEGKGDYRSINKFNRLSGKGTYFQNLGGALGSGLGGAVDSVAKIFETITGFGDYRKRAAHVNSQYKSNGIEGTSTAPFSNPNPLNMGAMNAQFNGGPPRVTKRERIGVVKTGAFDVTATTTRFNTQIFHLNPGLDELLPWGSSVAKGFEQYRLNGMIFEYVATATNYSTTASLGSVMMSTVYDANATPLASVAEVDNHEFTTMNTIDESFVHPIECATKENPITMRYVRSSNSITENDERFDDVGFFQISTQGCPNQFAEIGELWVSYNIEYFKPVLPDRHEGRSFQLSIHEDAGVWTFYPNTGNSLACTWSNAGPVPHDIRIDMPLGFSGAYLMTITGACASPVLFDYLTSYGFVASGPDIDWLALNYHRSNGVVPSSGVDGLVWNFIDQIFDMYSAVNTFQTIATNDTLNYITYRLPQTASEAPTHAKYSITVTALDNDIKPIVSLADPLEALLKRIEQLEGRRKPKTPYNCKPPLSSLPESTSTSSPPVLRSPTVLGGDVKRSGPASSMKKLMNVIDPNLEEPVVGDYACVSEPSSSTTTPLELSQSALMTIGSAITKAISSKK